jgi:ABC-type bacteriocin/lantibiotic exporter with double-glycine peptidase domain
VLIKCVRQKDASGCGIACVAIVTGTPYETVKRLMFGDIKRRGFHTETLDLKRALRQLGRKPGARAIPLQGRHLSDLNFQAIVATNRNPAGTRWHWVVWDGKKVLDPRGKASTRLRPFAYLKVE